MGSQNPAKDHGSFSVRKHPESSKSSLMIHTKDFSSEVIALPVLDKDSGVLRGGSASGLTHAGLRTLEAGLCKEQLSVGKDSRSTGLERRSTEKPPQKMAQRAAELPQGLRVLAALQ